VAMVEAPLPASIVAQLKKEMGDDQTDLKYVILPATLAPKNKIPIEDILGIADCAKRYSLNQNDFQSACHAFANRPLEVLKKGTAARKRRQEMKHFLLPEPKVGMRLYRKDSRRRGKCLVVEILEDYTRIKWEHSGKTTKILSKNLMSPALYALKDPFSTK